MSKLKILCITDSAIIHSGMGIAAKQILSRLHATGRYTVSSFGWFFNSAQQKNVKWDLPWKQYTTSRNDKPYGHPNNWPNSSDVEITNSPVYQVINDLFKPDIVIGIGDYWMCFPTGTDIKTYNGVKAIEDIQIGDYIISHTGSKREVKQTFIRQYSGNLIKIKYIGNTNPICVTPEHPFLAGKQQFVKAKTLKEGDFILSPITKANNREISYDLSKYSKFHSKNFCWDKINNKHKRYINIEEDLCRIFGYYLAEGFCSNSTVGFTFSNKEQVLVNNLSKILKKYFGVLPIIKKHNTYIRVNYCSHILSKFLKDLFSTGSRNKKICDELLQIGNSKLLQIFYGWFLGDGHIDATRKAISITTTSKQLVYQMKNIIERNVIISSLYTRIDKRPNKTKDLTINYILHIGGLDKIRFKQLFGIKHRNGRCEHSKNFIKDGFIYRKIKSIEKVNVKDISVYNLEVDKDNSYIANDIAVHNCDYITALPNRHKFKFIWECPIDGEPIPKSWIKELKSADVLISMSEYGKRVIQDRDKYCSVEVIPRGIDTNEFFKINTPKDKLRESLMPTARGRFLIGLFDRFQDRKQIGRALEAFTKFISDGKHNECDLYLHMNIHDSFSTNQKKTLDGEDGLIQRYGIKDRIIINQNVTVEQGVSTQELNALYNCCNVRLSTTQGEGFGLTLTEAMACGLPVISTNYTTPVELLGTDGKRGLLANVQAYITGMYNIERALVDTNHVAQLLDRLYRSPSLRKEMGENARLYIQRFKWDTIIKRWEQVINNCVKQVPYRLMDTKNIQSEDTKDINIYGAIRENTGWAITTAGIAQGFQNIGWDVKISEGGGVSPNFILNPELDNLTKKETSKNLAFINHMPEHAFKIATQCNAKYKIIYFPFELSHMTCDIVTNLNRLADIYLCPTKFVENIAKKSGVLNTAVIPLASNINTKAEPKDLGTEKGYKFLMVGNLGDKRKNVATVIKAFITSFTNDDDVCLILKSIPGHEDSDPSEFIINELLGRKNPPEIRVIHNDDQDIAPYYAACDCLLMSSFAEGWGHPVFQALKFGMPIIASNYGGYLDFIHRGKNVQLIDGEVGYAKKSPQYKAHECWFIPNFDLFVGAMKKAFAVNMRKTGEDYVADYTWDETAKAIENIYDTKIDKQPKIKVYYERMVKNLWNEDNELGFKGYTPAKYIFVKDPDSADFQILDITRISDKYYLKCKKYILFFHTFGENADESPTEYYDLFKEAMLVYSHIDLASIYPTIDKSKFMRGPWGVQPDIWFKKEYLKNDKHQIFCTGEIASTEGIRECVAACDKLNKKLLHIGHNFNYQNRSYVNRSNLSKNEMSDAYNQSMWVSALRRIEGFEKPAIEGLLCGARPICFDTPLYRYWYGDLARYVREGTEQETCDDIIKVMKEEYSPVTPEEMERAIKKFAWFYVAKNFWEKINSIEEGT